MRHLFSKLLIREIFNFTVIEDFFTDGIACSYYENGEIEEFYYIVNKKINGKYIQYNKNSKIVLECFCEDNEIIKFLD